MPQQRTPHRRRRHPRLDQSDLFDAPRRGPPREPGWNVLPEAVRRDVMTALTRLMADHRRQRRLPGREARHDD